MIADLHAHYPMHLVPDEKGSPLDAITTASGRHRFRDRIRAWLVGLAAASTTTSRSSPARA